MQRNLRQRQRQIWVLQHHFRRSIAQKGAA